jgi:hypothetical protein
MKTATLPPLRVDPRLKKSILALLEPGETLSSFSIKAIAKAAARRKAEKAFIARALASERQAERTGRWASHEAVMAKAEAVVARAKRRTTRR